MAETNTYIQKIKEVVKNTQKGEEAEIRSKHEDEEMIENMPVTLSLIGCKWDLF